MKEFIEYIVKNLVEDPEKVDINCYEGERGVVIEVKVGSDDMGKVVGRRGMTINAIRTIATTACARMGRRVRVEVVE